MRNRVTFGRKQTSNVSASHSDLSIFNELQLLTANRKAALHNGDLSAVREINHQIARLERRI